MNLGLSDGAVCSRAQSEGGGNGWHFPGTLALEQETSSPLQNESGASKKPPLLSTNSPLTSGQGTPCFCLAQTWHQGTGGGKADVMRKDQPLGYVGFGIWTRELYGNRKEFP